jgi:hypothetical protein
MRRGRTTNCYINSIVDLIELLIRLNVLREYGSWDEFWDNDRDFAAFIRRMKLRGVFNV